MRNDGAPPIKASNELAAAVRAITGGKRRRLTGRIVEPTEQPEALPAERKSVPRVVSEADTTPSGVGGLVDPIMIQPYTGGDVYQKVSSDGLFVREIAVITTTIDDGGDGVTNTWVQPDPAA